MSLSLTAPSLSIGLDLCISLCRLPILKFDKCVSLLGGNPARNLDPWIWNYSHKLQWPFQEWIWNPSPQQKQPRIIGLRFPYSHTFWRSLAHIRSERCSKKPSHAGFWFSSNGPRCLRWRMINYTSDRRRRGKQNTASSFWLFWNWRFSTWGYCAVCKKYLDDVRTSAQTHPI